MLIFSINISIREEKMFFIRQLMRFDSISMYSALFNISFFLFPTRTETNLVNEGSPVGLLREALYIVCNQTVSQGG